MMALVVVDVGRPEFVEVVIKPLKLPPVVTITETKLSDKNVSELDLPLEVTPVGLERLDEIVKELASMLRPELVASIYDEEPDKLDPNDVPEVVELDIMDPVGVLFPVQDDSLRVYVYVNADREETAISLDNEEKIDDKEDTTDERASDLVVIGAAVIVLMVSDGVLELTVPYYCAVELAA